MSKDNVLPVTEYDWLVVKERFGQAADFSNLARLAALYKHLGRGVIYLFYYNGEPFSQYIEIEDLPARIPEGKFKTLLLETVEQYKFGAEVVVLVTSSDITLEAPRLKWFHYGIPEYFHKLGSIQPWIVEQSDCHFTSWRRQSGNYIYAVASLFWFVFVSYLS